jgi:hypothetical protein
MHPEDAVAPVARYDRTGMMKRRLTNVTRIALVTAIAFGLLAGPAAAACVSCCPQPTAEAAFVATPPCCGHCGPTVAPSTETAPQIVKSAPTPAAPQLGVDAASHPSELLAWAAMSVQRPAGAARRSSSLLLTPLRL